MLVAKNLKIQKHLKGKLRLNIEDLSLKLHLGRITCIIGESGVGKSTIASILGGLLYPDSGEVYFEDKPVSQPHSPISVVIQDYKNAVFPWLTVEENIRLAEHKPITKNGSYNYDEIIRLLEIPTEILHEHPNHLSGGQIQRVQIARALFSGCKFLILDEPTSSLDMKFCADLQRILISLKKEFNVGILLITHNIEEAIYLADDIYVAKENEDKIVFVKYYTGFSHITVNISSAQHDQGYRKTFEEIYNYLFNENQEGIVL
jgi:NitT/TauT family transport system ATP-binding protein